MLQFVVVANPLLASDPIQTRQADGLLNKRERATPSNVCVVTKASKVTAIW